MEVHMFTFGHSQRPASAAQNRRKPLAWMAFFVPSVLLIGSAAQAADNGFYLGAGVTQAKVDDIFNTNLKIDNTAYKIIAGIRPLDFLAVEANYIDLGEETTNFTVGSARADAKAFAAFGMLFLPIPIVDVYAKAGLARWKLDGSANAAGVSFTSLDKKGTEFAYGAGAQLTFGSLGARLEYETFDIDNTDGADLVTLGVTYTFL
jgi:hypothetical protein